MKNMKIQQISIKSAVFLPSGGYQPKAIKVIIESSIRSANIVSFGSGNTSKALIIVTDMVIVPRMLGKNIMKISFFFTVISFLTRC